MAYIDKAYYDSTFCGIPIPAEEFNRLADISSDVVYDVCLLKPTGLDLIDENFKKAVAYQVELLYEQGGVSAIVGFSELAHTSGSESLGDYTISGGSQSQPTVRSRNGIPVSSMTLMLLRKMGLMSRWAYAGRERNG